MNFAHSVILLTAGLCVAGMSCNKNSLELPPVSAQPSQLRMQATFDGISTLEFIFKQVSVAGGDTLKLYFRNPTMQTLENIRYIAELCQAAEQNFDNCHLQFTDTITKLKASDDEVLKATWVNTGVMLDAKMINVGILSVEGKSLHPLSGVYGNISAGFENEDISAMYFGQIRGYVLADGSATFRIKSALNENFNATGLFTGLEAFDGQLGTPGITAIPYRLDSIGAPGARKLIDTTGGKCAFRMRFAKPLDNKIHSILSLTSKH